VCWASAMSIQFENNETQCRKIHCVEKLDSTRQHKKFKPNNINNYNWESYRGYERKSELDFVERTVELPPNVVAVLKH
jgi:hypothetical protein